MDPFLLLSTLLVDGLALLVCRRLFLQRRELARRIAAEEAARGLALQDPLTGLANRRSFETALDRALSAPPGSNAVHALLLVDLNGFKRVNDANGHTIGDELLTIIGRRLASLAPGFAFVARLGGDEFGVIASQLPGAEAANGLGRRIIEAIEEPVIIGAKAHVVGAGVGIALFPHGEESPAEIFRRADVALYRAKATALSSIRFYEPEMDIINREREQLERDLRQAIRDGALHPHYQPLIDLQTGEVLGFEALARWRHEVHGSVPPTRFIPIAEDCGLIRELSSQLLRQACSDACDWPSSILLAFNVSPHELKDHTLGLRILSILAETGLPPSRLELEIPESALVRDLPAAQHTLTSLRAAGIRIALDDFGAGYSSLYHLRNFKVDKVKIDRSFVDSMRCDGESAAIVRALLGLGRGLGLAVTAEGIERADQAAHLLGAGCGQGQGFLYGQPLTATAARNLVSAPPVARTGS